MKETNEEDLIPDFKISKNVYIGLVFLFIFLFVLIGWLDCAGAFK